MSEDELAETDVVEAKVSESETVEAPFWEQNRILHVLCGSRAYGLETAESDWDTRGVCIPPKRYLLGLERFEQHVSDDDDHVTYSLEKFVRLALAGNPNIVETLFTEGESVLSATPLGEHLISSRDLFLSRRVGQRFCGYAREQLHRIRRHRRWIEDPPSEPSPLTFGGREEGGRLRWSNASAQKSYKAAHKRWKQFQEWRERRNPKRATLEHRHGYDTKHAMHLCRLLVMGEEILKTGRVQVMRPDGAWLKAVRQGLLSYPELVQWADERTERLAELEASSPLPVEPDEAAAEELVIELQEAFHFG